MSLRGWVTAGCALLLATGGCGGDSATNAPDDVAPKAGPTTAGGAPADRLTELRDCFSKQGQFREFEEPDPDPSSNIDATRGIAFTRLSDTGSPLVTQENSLVVDFEDEVGDSAGTLHVVVAADEAQAQQIERDLTTTWVQENDGVAERAGTVILGADDRNEFERPHVAEAVRVCIRGQEPTVAVTPSDVPAGLESFAEELSEACMEAGAEVLENLESLAGSGPDPESDTREVRSAYNLIEGRWAFIADTAEEAALELPGVSRRGPASEIHEAALEANHAFERALPGSVGLSDETVDPGAAGENRRRALQAIVRFSEGASAVGIGACAGFGDPARAVLDRF